MRVRLARAIPFSIPVLAIVLGGTAAGDCSRGLSGIDVSTFNGTVDWAQAADGGVSFAFAKASEGLTIRDEQFPANWSGMKSSGVVRGAYHFFRADDDGAAQADVFLACVGSFEEGDLPPVLDWETSDGSDVAATLSAARAFMAEVQRLTGLPTIIYTTLDYWSSLGDPRDFAANPLWLASDNPTCPIPPPPWVEWLFWQYSSEGTVPGVSGAVDLDRFAGSFGDLLSLAGFDAGSPGAPAADAGAEPGNQAPTMPGDAGQETPSARSSGCEEGAGSSPACSLAILVLLLAQRRAQVRR